jgi:hypothetical protein
MGLYFDEAERNRLAVVNHVKPFCDAGQMQVMG